MLVFGAGFDALPWAKEIIESPEPQGSQLRMERLSQAALSRLDGKA